MTNNLDIEKSILSHFIVFPNYIEDYINKLNVNYFESPIHQKIYIALVLMFHKKEDINIITLKAKLKTVKASYIVELTEYPVSYNLNTHIDILKNNYMYRQLTMFANTIIGDCKNEKELSTITEKAFADLTGITSTHTNQIMNNFDLTNRSLDRYSSQFDGKSKTGIKLGFKEFDALTGGIINPEFIVIAGRPGSGKTSFSLALTQNMSIFIMENNLPDKIGFISMEMVLDRIEDRLFAMNLGINTMQISQGFAAKNKEVLRKMSEFASLKSNWPIQYYEGVLEIQKLKSVIRQMASDGCTNVFIDQLSFVKVDGCNDLFTRYSIACNEIARLKTELGITIWLLSQLNRELEKRSDKRPQLSDLRQTGSLEEDADKVFLLFRPIMYNDRANPTDASICLAKNRDGATWESNEIEYIEKLTLYRDKK